MNSGRGYQRGPLYEILAPGVNICASRYDSYAAGYQCGDATYVNISGTSMATPHVAGAIALFQQFFSYQNKTKLTVDYIEYIMNATGHRITDSGQTNLTFSRLNVSGVINALDTRSPQVSFEDTSPLNSSAHESGYAIINITSDETLFSALVEVSGANNSMTGDSTKWNYNLTGGGSYNYTVFGIDLKGWVTQTEMRSITFGNMIPQIHRLNITSTDSKNYTNGTLVGVFTPYDANGDTLVNDTRWYNNTVELTRFRNFTEIGFGNTTKGDNWTISVRTYDGENFSIWYNATMEILNSPPTIAGYSQRSLNYKITELINFSILAWDIDQDSISYTVNNSNFMINLSNTNSDAGFTKENVSISWLTTAGDVGLYEINITSTDSVGTSYVLFNITVENNSVPVVSGLALTPVIAYSNDTLVPSFSVTDTDSDTLTNETRWYNNTVEVVALRNASTLGSSYTGKNQNWTVSVRAYDGYNLSAWSNSTREIINAEPFFNETNFINLTFHAYDVDNDFITWNINDSSFSKFNNTFIWNTTVNDSSYHVLNLTINDSTVLKSRIVSVTILDNSDWDGDGIPDSVDPDDDNDGLNDTSDYLTGNNVNSTITNITVTVNSSTNLTQIWNTTLLVNISNNLTTIVEFNWTFNASNILILQNLTVLVSPANSSNGSILVQGLKLGEQNTTKTVYFDRILNGTGICIKDIEINSIKNISNSCNGANETWMTCPGISGGYNCSYWNNDTQYRLSGLLHSGAKELATYCGDSSCNGGETCSSCSTDCGSCATPTVTPSGGGGGGGGGGGSIAKEVSVTSGSWTVYEWSIHDKPFFTHNEVQHRIFIDRFTDLEIELSIYSERKVVKLAVGKWVGVDLDSDNVNDIDVRYEGKTGYKAKVGLRYSTPVDEAPKGISVSEDIPEEVVQDEEEIEEPETIPEVVDVSKKSFSWIYYVIGVLVLVGAGFVGYYMYQNKREDEAIDTLIAEDKVKKKSKKK